MNLRPDPSPDTSFEPSGDFAAAISDFRTAVHHIAERETSKPVPASWLIPARRRHKSAQRRIVLAWSLVAACAALLCIGTLPLLHQTKPVVDPPVVAHQNNPSDDTALLEQVDNAVSESVPSSLAPLADLDSWNSATSTNELDSKSSLNQPEKKNVVR